MSKLDDYCKVFRDDYLPGQWEPAARPGGQKKWCLVRRHNDGYTDFYTDKLGRVVYFTLEGVYRKAVRLQRGIER